MFQPGQKVVCVDDMFPPAILPFFTSLPEKDKVYVVRGIAPALNLKREDDIAVYLVGLINPCSSTPPHRERGFAPERFVPLQELPPEDVVEREPVDLVAN